MCLIVKKGTEIKIAEEDITCYKILNNVTIKSGFALYYTFEYIFGQKYIEELSPIDGSLLSLGKEVLWADSIAKNTLGPQSTYKDALINAEVYQKGFHSYESIDRLLKVRSISLIETIVVCTIPKGYKYVEDSTGLICSEAIIVKCFI